jgi:hypothetical protein
VRPASAAVSQGFGGGGRSSSNFSCTCICITNYFYSLTDKGSFSLCDLTTTSACMEGSWAPAAEAGTQKCQCAQEQQGPTLSTASPSSMPPSTSLHASLVRSGSTCVPNRHQARGACDVGRGLGLKQSVKGQRTPQQKCHKQGPTLSSASPSSMPPNTSSDSCRGNRNSAERAVLTLPADTGRQWSASRSVFITKRPQEAQCKPARP